MSVFRLLVDEEAMSHLLSLLQAHTNIIVSLLTFWYRVSKQRGSCIHMTHLQLCLTRIPNISRARTTTPACNNAISSWSVRHRKTACRCSRELPSSDASKEELLKYLSSLSPAGLKKYIDNNGDNINLSFFEWLASREDHMEGDDKLELNVLAGQLMAIKEGLEPLGFDDVADKLQQHWEATTAAQASSTALSSTERLSDVGTTDSNTTDDNTDALLRPSEALTKLEPSQSSFQLMQPFSDAGIARQIEQVRLLNVNVKVARASSTVQIIGRKDLDRSGSHAGPQSVSSAAHRILEYLLQLQSADLRREVLPDAFQSQPDTSEQGYDESSESYDADNEQLSTTPLQLLQAIDLEVARLSKGTSGMLQGQHLLPGGNPTCINDVKHALQQLRQDVLDCWEGE